MVKDAIQAAYRPHSRWVFADGTEIPLWHQWDAMVRELSPIQRMDMMVSGAWGVPVQRTTERAPRTLIARSGETP